MHFFFNLGLVLVQALAAAVAGRKALELLGFSFEGERAGFSLGLAVGIVGMSFALLGVLGWVRPVTLGTLVLGFLVAGMRPIRSWLRRSVQAVKAFRRAERNRFFWLLFLIFCVTVAANGIRANLPPALTTTR